MSVSAKSARARLRIVHLATTALLCAHIYAPWGREPWFRSLIQAVIVPLATLSGLWMWKGHKLSAWLKGRCSTSGSRAPIEIP